MRITLGAVFLFAALSASALAQTPPEPAVAIYQQMLAEANDRVVNLGVEVQRQAQQITALRAQVTALQQAAKSVATPPAEAPK